MDSQATSYHTYFLDNQGSGMFLQKTGGSMQNLRHKYASFSIAGGTTDGAIITAVSGKVLRIVFIDLCCVVTGVSTFRFNSKPAGAGTRLSPTYELAATEKIQRYFNPFGWFESVISEGITGTTGTNLVSGMIGYLEF
jgi:hypothetical protein